MKKLVVLLLFLAAQLGPIFVSSSALALSQTLLITKLQTSGPSSGTEEFVEIFNTSPEAVDVEGWKVEYLSAAGNLSNPALATLTGSVPAGATLLLAREGTLPDAPLHFTNGLSDTGGHIRIRNQDGETIDILGWGTASQPEIAAAPALSPGRQLERKINADGSFKETDNNAEDFALNDLAPASEPCEGIVLSEIMPNPAGTDGGHEFIELYNPTSAAVPLGGCSLTVNEKMFVLKGTLAAGTYQAVYDSETGLTLPNAAGGTVVLATTSADQAVQYPADMQDNETWATINGTWQLTNTPTPGAANVAATLASETGKGSGDEELAVCPAGKYRNPATNRCKNIETDDGLTPCKEGQVRNPETNRCRSISTASASLIPCKEGQERNPETNRCRSVAAASTTLKPCDPGEERNPETNRCRKASVASTAGKADAAAKQGQSKTSYAIVGTLVAGALGYGAYEYRTDLRNKLALVKTRLFPGQSSK